MSAADTLSVISKAMETMEDFESAAYCIIEFRLNCTGTDAFALKVDLTCGNGARSRSHSGVSGSGNDRDGARGRGRGGASSSSEDDRYETRGRCHSDGVSGLHAVCTLVDLSTPACHIACCLSLTGLGRLR